MSDGEFLCPVCGYGLDEPAWDGDLPSDEICPSCGIQFGYTDFAGNDPEKRKGVWKQWRERWVEEGCRWSSTNSPPEGWDPRAQLERVAR
jgi:hypothetical protein